MGLRIGARHLAIVIGLVVAGCSDSGPEPIGDPAAFLARWPKTHCAWAVRCGLFENASECAAFEHQGRETQFPPLQFDERLPHAVSRGTVVYDADAAGRCIAAMNTRSCSWHDWSAVVCNEVFIGTAPARAPVSQAFECVIPLANGDDGTCDDACCTLTCAETTIILDPDLPPEGSPCDGVSGCSYGLTCHRGRCTDPDRLGDSCIQPRADDHAYDYCADIASTCINGRCHRNGHVGDGCDGERAPPCARGLVCDPATDRCIGFLAAGAPCGYAHGGALCNSGLACNPTTDTCAALLSDAAPCEVDRQCASGHCSRISHTCGQRVVCP